ncbi:MliC family protein [Sandaracinobacter sp. RS1-74]|uniref:MliC family protein n=1 Tax=Sandaracinobacteroides sayramensis TaxID=2913411 RepID=UPI001EDC1D1E|nr:MliC family protein [Sandaracinobacteroides sayramensis]
MIRATGLALLLMLSACGEKPAEKPAEAPARQSQAKAVRTVAYTCEGDMAVTAIYGLDAEGRPDVALIIQGDDFRLTPTGAASGTRYASPHGAAAGKGIIWWEKDGEVLLQQAPADQVDDPAAGVTARTCKVKTEPSAIPKAKP